MENEDSENSNSENIIIQETIVEEIVVEEKPLDTKPSLKSKIKNPVYIIIAVLVIILIVIIALDYPKISSFIQKQRNPYGFDFNFSKVKAYDWDTIATDKKVAKALGEPLENVNSTKAIDYSWVLEKPDEFVKAGCAALVNKNITNEVDSKTNNSFHVTVMICKDKATMNELYSTRLDDVKSVPTKDPSYTINKVEDTKGIGEKGYIYLVDKKATEIDPKDPTSEASPAGKFAGLTFARGPFMVLVEEAEEDGEAVLSTDSIRNKLAGFIDSELRNILTWY